MTSERTRAPVDLLPPDHRQALFEACDAAWDALFDDAAAAESKEWDVDEAFIAQYLPRRYLQKYTPGFVRQFQVTLGTVAWKLNQHTFIAFACVAEELAAWAIVQTAEWILEIGGIEANFARFVTLAFKDTDFLNLYNDAMDGIDQSELAAVMGMTSLRLEDWFTPFDADIQFGAVHPYGQPYTDIHTDNQPDELM